jgi:predicted enzyme involved in methoxymalonyl-ACP biosynthesis
MTANTLYEPIPIAREAYQGYSFIVKDRNSFIEPVIESSFIDNMLLKVSEFESLQENWDGHNAKPISKKVIFNANMFLKRLPGYYSDKLNIEDIVPTPYGTIVIDWYNEDEELLSMEIGKTKIGYFTEFHHNDNALSKGIDFEDNYSIPNELINVLRSLYPGA